MLPSAARSQLVRSDLPLYRKAAPSTNPKPIPSQVSTQPRSSLGGKTSIGLQRGIGLKRHRKVLRDNIQGITRGDIRRLARRGGVKRISADIYSGIRSVVKRRLEEILMQLCAVLACSGKKTITVRDVVFVLNRMGKPIYGFGGTERVKG